MTPDEIDIEVSAYGQALEMRDLLAQVADPHARELLHLMLIDLAVLTATVRQLHDWRGIP